MARWPLFPHPLHSRSSVGGNRMHEGSEPLSREIRASSAITRGTWGLFLGKIQFVLIHTWKAKGTKSLFSFIKYARRHSWNTDRSFWKAVPRSFLPLPERRFALKTTAQLETDDSIRNGDSDEPKSLKSLPLATRPVGRRSCAKPRWVIPAAAGESRAPSSIPSLPPRCRHCCAGYNHPKEHFTGGLALAKGTLQRDQENMETRFIRHAWSDNNGTASCCLSFLTFRGG